MHFLMYKLRNVNPISMSFVIWVYFISEQNIMHLWKSLSRLSPAGDHSVWGAAGPRPRPALHALVAGQQRPLLRGRDGLAGVLRGGRRERAGLGERHPPGSDARAEQRGTRRGEPGWAQNDPSGYSRY